MTLRRAFPTLLVLASGLAASSPDAASGQSIFSAAGLGSPTESADARSRALGSEGIGLPGTGILPHDPAAAAGLLVPTVVFTAQPGWVESVVGEGLEASDYRSTRFPLAGIAYPAWGLGTATLTVGSFLDQRYEATRSVTLELEGGPVGATDEFESRGGISEIRLGLARPLSGSIAAGLSVGRYNGSSVRTLTRSLDGVAAEESVEPFESVGAWDFSGTSVTAGLSANLGDLGRLAGSVTWSSDLSADAADGTDSDDRSFELPLRYSVGATVLVGPALALVGSASGADWESTGAGLIQGEAGSTLSWGAGVELVRASIFGRSAPIRFGYHRTDLPFRLEGGSPRESVWAGGLGLALSQSGEVVLAGLDLSLERGERVEVAIEERFWRASLTLRVAGF